MGYITKTEFDKATYKPGDNVTLTVWYDIPSESRVPIGVVGVLGSVHQLLVPAVRVTMAGTAWELIFQNENRTIFRTTAPDWSTVSDTVYFDWLGNREVRTVSYSVTASSIRFGWDNRDVQELMALYPKTTAYAVYQNLDQLFPSWDSLLLNTDPRVTIHMHFKNPALLSREAILTHIQMMPEQRKTAIRAGQSQYFMTYHHEPEQQTGDDPPDDVWRDRWVNWLHVTLPSLPTDVRDLFKVGPHYTDYYRRRNADWESRYGTIASDNPVEFVAFSIYDNETEPYRTTEDMFGPALSYADSVDLPLVIAEYNRNREVAIDPDGSICAQRMLDDAAFLTAESDVIATPDGVEILAVLQFHNGGGDLRNRPNEQAAFWLILDRYYPFD